MAQPLLCVNCNIRVNTLRRHLVFELDTRFISIISTWISPVIVTEEDYICEACYNLAMEAVNVQINRECNDAGAGPSSCGDVPGAGPSPRGHVDVCLICGRSLITRQSHLILRQNPSQIIQRMIEMIENRIAPRQISSGDHTCHACWLKVQRDSVRAQQIDEARNVEENLADIPRVEEHDDFEEDRARVEEHDDFEEDLARVEEHDDDFEEDHDNVASRPQTPENLVEQSQTGHTVPEITVPNYKRGPNTASHCLFFGCDNLTNLHTVSDSLRSTILSNYNYYIPKLARICSEHLYSNSWDVLYNAENSMATFTGDQIAHIFSFVNAFKPFLDFSSMESVQEMDEQLFGHWLGMTRDNFIVLLNELPRIREKHRGILGLAALLLKMRGGDSDERISTLLEVPRSTLERLMSGVREILLQDFVPRNLGINALTRQQLLEHSLSVPNALYNENYSNAIVICDGTYIYVNKSSNYMFQKDSYSLHKYRNLLKPFLIVACDGYIVDCCGPYKATTSDAQIMTSLFRDEDSPLRQYFLPNDVFILDRGFRDSIPLLENCNYKVYTPDSLLEGEHQLTTEQANRSRCVTMCRWVVEAVNGYFKRDFRLLRFDHFNKTVPNMMAYFQIAASLINKFGVRLRDNPNASQIISIVRERMPLTNNLSRMVEDLNLNRRASLFRSITANDNNVAFPRLEYNDLILFALGTYQIRQARSYYGEHVRFHGGYRIEVSRGAVSIEVFGLRGSGQNSLIKGKIKSRHVSRRQYYVYIMIENNMNGREAITEYCCSCLVGRRTVGCCAHTMTLVWYLGWARYQNNIAPPAALLDYVVIRDDFE